MSDFHSETRRILANEQNAERLAAVDIANTRGDSDSEMLKHPDGRVTPADGKW